MKGLVKVDENSSSKISNEFIKSPISSAVVVLVMIKFSGFGLFKKSVNLLLAGKIFYSN